MPVRVKAVDRMLREQGRRVSFNNLDWTAKVDGEEMTRDDFDERFWEPMDRLYEAVVDTIDWNRVMLEATARHIALDHEHTEDYGYVCPACICEALLAPDTFQEWDKNPNVKRTRS